MQYQYVSKHAVAKAKGLSGQKNPGVLRFLVVPTANSLVISILSWKRMGGKGRWGKCTNEVPSRCREKQLPNLVVRVFEELQSAGFNGRESCF